MRVLLMGLLKGLPLLLSTSMPVPSTDDEVTDLYMRVRRREPVRALHITAAVSDLSPEVSRILLWPSVRYGNCQEADCRSSL